MHITPTSGSWLNLVEIFFSIITRQAIRRGSFASVRDLIDAIRAFIDSWNERCHRYAWTKTADQILPYAKEHHLQPLAAQEIIRQYPGGTRQPAIN
jgi:hypothetical protein